jgi:nucleoid-associated protein YgaU
MASTTTTRSETRTPPSRRDRGEPGLPSPARRRVRIPQLALGLLLAGGAALAFVLFQTASTQRIPVLALAVDVERGQTIVLEDLRVVQVGIDQPAAVTPADQAGLVVGRTVVADLPAGTLLSGGLVTSTSPLLDGGGVVGLALNPGQYPTPRLMVGDLVMVVEVSDGPRLLTGTAEVVDIETVATQGQRFISLLTDETTAAEIAAADATGEVRLVAIAREGGADAADEPDTADAADGSDVADADEPDAAGVVESEVGS